MQEEIENRTINLVITTSRLSARVLMDGLRQFVNNAQSHTRLRKEAHSRKKMVKLDAKVRQAEQKKAEGPHGKQSVKQLIQHSNGVRQIPVEKSHMREFQRVLKEYGVDFALVKDSHGEKPKYLAFFKAKDKDVLDSVIKECSARHMDKEKTKRPSMLAEMKKLKELVAKTPRKHASKEKDLSL